MNTMQAGTCVHISTYQLNYMDTSIVATAIIYYTTVGYQRSTKAVLWFTYSSLASQI